MPDVYPLPDRLDPGWGFPAGMPGSGERVPRDPADFLRDMFLLHRGRIGHHKAENMVGRMTFTYGREILDTWIRLQAEGYLARDGEDWIFVLQVQLAERRDAVSLAFFAGVVTGTIVYRVILKPAFLYWWRKRPMKET